MKLTLLLSTALLAGVISATATSANSAAMMEAATNANPDVSMQALFGDPVIVKAKDFTIKQSELDDVLSGAKANAAAQGRKLPPAFTDAILNQLITIHCLLPKATAADRAAGAAEAAEQFTNLVQHFGSLAAFNRQLMAVGMTAKQLRAKATQEATAKAALKRILKVHVTDAEAKAFYNQHQAEFEQPQLAHVRHILILTIDPKTHEPLPTNVVAQKRKEIDGLLKKIHNGASFSTLATEYSEDPGSKNNGGELPPFSRGEMVPAFETAAFALTNGEVSSVIKTQYGFHIIKMIDKTPAKKFNYDEMVPSVHKTVAQICKAEVEAQQIRKLAPAYIKKLRAEQDVQIVDPSLKQLDEAVREQMKENAEGGGDNDTNSPSGLLN